MRCPECHQHHGYGGCDGFTLFDGELTREPITRGFEMPEKYLHIEADGTLTETDQPPTDDDDAAVNDGLIDIVRFNGCDFEQRCYGEWIPLGDTP